MGKLRSNSSIEDAGQTTKMKKASSIQADRTVQSSAPEITFVQNTPAVSQVTAILGTCPAASCQYPSQTETPKGKLGGHADLRENQSIHYSTRRLKQPSCSSQVWQGRNWIW